MSNRYVLQEIYSHAYYLIKKLQIFTKKVGLHLEIFHIVLRLDL